MMSSQSWGHQQERPFQFSVGISYDTEAGNISVEMHAFIGIKETGLSSFNDTFKVT